MAVFEYISATGIKKYRVMVSADDVTSFPVIVNECLSKGDEFTFQQVDYKKLITTGSK